MNYTYWTDYFTMKYFLILAVLITLYSYTILQNSFIKADSADSYFSDNLTSVLIDAVSVENGTNETYVDTDRDLLLFKNKVFTRLSF